jgi:hypothetical protein
MAMPGQSFPLAVDRVAAGTRYRWVAMGGEASTSSASPARLNGYRIGAYPTNKSSGDRYAPARGLIEVHSTNQDTQLSEHFKLKEFLTHDQRNVWPKYAYVDGRLLDKLELVIADQNARGVRTNHMVELSGFRTPQYNARGQRARW